MDVTICRLYERSCGNGKILSLDCINANILAMIVYCSFTICYDWGKMV